MNDDLAALVRLAGFNANYAACLDEGRFDDWSALFLEDGRYRVVARENYDRGHPLSLIDLQGIGMLRDRIYAIESTLFYAPYYQRHIIGMPRIVRQDGDVVVSESNYVVIRTKRDKPGEVFNAGRYVDRFVMGPDGPRLAERACVYDTDLIPNSLVYPI
jgi:salicylate 5-hydroxylase small subunit